MKVHPKLLKSRLSRIHRYETRVILVFYLPELLIFRLMYYKILTYGLMEPL